MEQILGIDIGGSGIKGGVVDMGTGQLVTERHRVPTPRGARPEDVAAAIVGVIEHHGYRGPVGCTFPGVVRGGTVLTAANVHRSWKGTDAAALFGRAAGLPVTVLNDADAAGLAEMRFGVGALRAAGVVVVVTLGTGIGTAVFTDGRLVPNTELGHIEIDGVDAETRAASRWREEQDLSWKEWGGRVDWYLRHLELLVWPDLFVIGGGVSRRHDQFFPYLHPQTPVVAAELRNNAGIVGAALRAVELS